MHFTAQQLDQLTSLGVSHHWNDAYTIPSEFRFEAPCRLIWSGLHGRAAVGAFSYMVSGYFANFEIARYSSVGESVQAGRGDHPMDWLSTSPIMYDQTCRNDFSGGGLGSLFEDFAGKTFFKTYDADNDNTIRVGNDVWIGHGAFIKPGIRIGNGAIVAAMAVVTKDVPPYAIVAGQPARIIRYRFNDDQIARLQAVQWWRFAPHDLRDVEFDQIDRALDQIEERVATGLEIFQPRVVTNGDLV